MADVRGLAILLWSLDPDQPDLCATPFMHAAAAAALDLQVEVHFAARSVRLLRRGTADTLYASADRSRSILAFMAHAHEHGAKFLVCAASLAAQRIDRSELIDQVDGLVGATSYVARVVEPAWRGIVF